MTDRPAEPPADKPAPKGKRGDRKRGSPMLKAIRRAVAGFLVLVLVIGGYLWFYAAHQRAYLTARNHRTLASLSIQLGEKLRSTDQLLRSARGILTKARVVDSAADFVPAFRHLGISGIPESAYVARNAQACVDSETDSARVDSLSKDGRWRHDPRAPAACVYRGVEVLVATEDDSIRRRALAHLNLATYLKDDFQARGFDKALIADTAGRVLVEVGAPAVVLTHLPGVLEGSGADSSATWSRLSAGSAVGEAKLFGKTYRFLLEPCCRLSSGASWDQPLLVAGLVDKGRLLRESLRISPSLLANFTAILILMALAWPFLKIRLIGERQQVRLIDGVSLGLASVLGAGLTAIFLFDLYAYSISRAGRDGALRELAEEIQRHLRTEIGTARAELRRLYDQAAARKDTTGLLDRQRIPKDQLAFPFFESWSLIDRDGRQVRKWSTDAYVQPLIPVRDRDYFRAMHEAQGWSGPAGALEDSFYVESTVSRTTGKRQAALAIRVADSMNPVASMAMELLSLIHVALPPGYGFAVLDPVGQVLFHSDPTRNLDELFFSEADDNRRLLSAIATRGVDTLNIRYGGVDHRAFVTPLLNLPWTLVTFLDKEPGRIANAESLLSGVYLTLVYTVLMIAIAAVVLMLVPGYRAPWLWPDRRLYAGYVHVGLINALFLLAFLVAFLTLERDDLLAAAFTLPVAALAASWASLTQSSKRARLRPPQAVTLATLVLLGSVLLRSQVASWPHLAVYLIATGGSLLALLPPVEQPSVPTSITGAYVTWATLFLLIIGAMPAAAFFKLAFTAHGDMLTKGAQLHLARRLEHRADSIQLAYTDELGQGKSGARARRLCAPREDDELCGLDLYYRFSGTSLTDLPERGDLAPVASPDSGASADLVTLFLAPYRPEASVGWRGMHRAAAADSTWSWSVAGDSLAFLGSPVPGGQRWVLKSAAVTLWPPTPIDGLIVVLIGGLVLCLARFIAGFVAHRFFVIDVTDTVIVSDTPRIESVGGTNLFVVCRDAEEERRMAEASSGVRFSLRRRLRKGGELRWRVGEVAEGDGVVLTHFEHLKGDEASTRAKVDLLDTLVHEYNCDVMVLSGEHRDGAPLGLRAAWKLIQAGEGDQSRAAAALDSLAVVDAGRWLAGQRPPEERRLRTSASGPVSTAEAVIAEESRCDRHLAKIWSGLRRTLNQPSQVLVRRSREELLDVLGERAEAYYRDLWESCRPAERSVLVHLAKSGLVNEKDRRILRRLLARGLVRRQPNFVLMNETFRRYVLARADEVEAEVPPEPSTWDAVRRPVLMLGTALVILLFVTQQELFSATAATVAALGTGVATLSKIAGLFDRRPAGKAGE